MPKFKILRKRDQTFGGWGDFVGLTSGEVFHNRVIEAKDAEDAKQKASKMFGLPIETIEVEEVKQ